MADYTYIPGRTYINQSGQLVVASGSTSKVESGGVLSIESGGSISIASGGSITVAVTAGSTASTMTATGITTVKSTSGTKTYPIAAPVAGYRKTIVCTDATTSNVVKLDSGSGLSFDGTNRYITLKASDMGLEMVALSATAWAVTGLSGSTGKFAFVNS